MFSIFQLTLLGKLRKLHYRILHFTQYNLFLRLFQKKIGHHSEDSSASLTVSSFSLDFSKIIFFKIFFLKDKLPLSQTIFTGKFHLIELIQRNLHRPVIVSTKSCNANKEKSSYTGKNNTVSFHFFGNVK